MKKFFSAILLMTMMVFSVGTFVSCNDLVEEVETIKGQTSDIEAQISALETQIAALETALKGEIKSAADQAKADAIKEAKAECEVLKAAFEQALADKADTKALEELTALVEAKIAAIEPELAKMATKVELEDAVKKLVATDTQLATQIAALEAYKATADSNFVEIEAAIAEAEKLQAELKAYVEENYTELHNLIGKNASYIASCIEDIDDLKKGLAGYMETTDANIDEITGYLYSAIEDIDLLKGDVKKLQEALAALEPRVKDLEEKIEKVDADLKLINTAIKDLANQIQSVVYVPEGDVVVDSYTYGDVTTLRFLATYEVSPARLAGELANAKLYFTNVVKGEPAIYDAEFVSAKDGRVVVRGKITDKDSEAFKLLTGATSNASSVKVALHVDNAKPGTVGDTSYDGGTYVSSSFVPVLPATTETTHQLMDLVYLYDTEAGAVVVDPTTKARITTYEKNFNVPFTTPVSASAKALFPIDYRVKLEGNFVTLAEAAAIFGFEALTPAVKVSKVTYDSDKVGNEETKNFLKVTGDETINATVTLGRAATKYDINRYATANTTEIKIAGLDTGLKVVSTYKITTGEATDIMISDLNAAWSYKYGENYHWYYIDNTSSNIELTVQTPVDLTKQGLMIDYGTGSAELFNDWVTTGYGTTHFIPVTAYKADGSVYKVNNTPVTGSVGVAVRASNAVVISYPDVRFYDEALTYKAEFEVFDTNTQISYDGSFNINLGARPADKPIDLGTFTTTGADVNAVEIPVNAIAAVIAKDGSFYEDLPAAALVGYNFTSAGTTEEGNSTGLKLSFEYNHGTETNPSILYVPYYFDANEQAHETSKIVIPESASEYEKSYDLAYAYTFYGVKYTFKAKVDLKKPTIKLEANAMRVPSNGVVEMHGTYKVPTYNSTTKKMEAEVYELQKINLRELVKINNGGSNFASDEYQILYTLKTEYMDGTNKVSGNSIAEIKPYTGNSIDVDAEAIVDWKDTKVNELTYEIQLASAADADVKFGDPVTIKLVVPELVTVTGSQKKIDYNNATKISVGNFVQGLAIKDKATGKDLYNDNALFWDNTKKNGFLDATDSRATKDVLTDEYNIYDFSYEFGTVTGKLADGTPVDLGEDFKFYATATADRNAGDVEIDMNNSGIDQNVEIKIPVTIKHKYQGVGDNACEHTVTVTLLFLAE